MNGAKPCIALDQEGRLAGVGGLYMPGRDSNRLLDGFGLLLVAGSLFGVLGHGPIRVFTAKRGGNP